MLTGLALPCAAIAATQSTSGVHPPAARGAGLTTDAGSWASSAMCTPPASGSTCGGGGPASQGDVAGGGVDVGAGNPINLTNGNKHQTEIDLAPLPGVLGLEIVRHYNSASSGVRGRNGLFGRGWRSSYETTLHPAANAIRIVQADGASLRFDCAPSGAKRCRSDDPVHGFVDRRTTPDGEVFTWHWSHGDAAGRQLHFDRAGRLTRIAALSGEFVSLLYDPLGSLSKIVDPQGRVLEFHYPERRQARAAGQHAAVERIVSPTGTFHYRYGTAPLPGEDARLLKARRLALIAVAGPGEDDAAPLRSYHYEDPRHPTLLTGISVDARSGDGRRTARRLATYGYDAAGRGILSAPGDVAAEAVTNAGSTNRLVRLDFRTRPRRGFPGTTVLSTGDGTSTTYTVGLVADTYRLLEARGPGCPRCSPGNMRYRYDDAGRLAEAAALDTVSGQAVHSLRITRDGLGRVQRIDKVIHERGKPGVPRLVKRYEYAGEDARPAVVAIPSIVAGREHRLSLRYNAHGQIVEMRESGHAPLDENGKPVAGGSPIERTTTLRYGRINGRSLLVEVDGPLPNGSTASPADSDIMRLHHDEGGNRVESITHPMNLQERFEHDAAGRVVAHTPVDGVTVRLELDALGQPVRWERGEAIVHIDRDAFGRPLRITRPDGEILHLGHDGPDGLAAMVSNLGRGWWLSDAAAHPMPRRTGPFPEAVAIPRGRDPGPPRAAGDWAGLAQWIDDFGRMQAMRTDATGLEHFRYDAAGRLVERRFADGWTWRWTRDAAGRILAHSVSAHGTADALTTTLRYAGAQLVRIENTTQIETRTHDAMGRISSRTIERPASPGSAAVRYREAYLYDAADRLTRHELPEGGELHYEWGRGAQLRGIAWIDALRRRTQLLAPLSLPSLTRAQGSAHLAKPARPGGGYRFGNGTQVRFGLGADARLNELLHVLPQPSVPDHWPVWIAHAHANRSTPPGASGGSADTAGELIAGWRYDYDAAGRMVQRTDARLSLPTAFAFDRHARLIAAQPGIDTDRAEYYAYDATGTPVGRRREAITEDFRHDKLVRSEGGLPRQIGTYRLHYSADRRLTEVRETIQGGAKDAPEHIVARYAHDALGQRIRKTVFSARNDSLAPPRSTHFLWDSYRLVGEVVEAQGAPRLTRRYIYAHGVPVAILDYPAGRQLATQGAPLSEALRAIRELLGGTAPQVRYIHANEIGTPTAVTDERGRVVWRAAHALYGEARVTAAAVGSGDFRLNLRLPGQYHDAETGWHDNVLRTYDPRRGQYLEPDPLGPHPLTRPYAYAANDPLRYADPLGLILFAFDGTGNNESSRTNVFWLREAYEDNDSALIAGSDRPYYMEGVGTKWYLLGDDALAYTLKPKVQEQLTSLDSYVRAKFDHEVREGGKTLGPTSPLLITLDVVGFSRGAAAARDFVNEVIARRNQAYYRDLVGGACVGVQIRFLGLFDTVLSQQVNGTISLGIPASQIGRVAHAVAANEHRALFPLESAESAYEDRGLGANIVELGFVGAHADIGGGYTVEDGGDLSDVALNWMHQQAVAAGVPMKALEPAQRLITQPIVHDESRVWPWNVPPFSGGTDDREVRYPNQVQQQRNADFEGMNHAESLVYIVPDPLETPPPDHYQDGIAPTPPASNRIGLVDMARYEEWLARNYGLTFDEENTHESTSVH